MDEPFPLAIVNMHMVNKNFITQPKPWYEIAYTSGCHYDGISPIRTDCQVTPPPLTGYVLSETIGLFHLIRVPPLWMTELFAYPGTKILP